MRATEVAVAGDGAWFSCTVWGEEWVWVWVWAPELVPITIPTTTGMTAISAARPARRTRLCPGGLDCTPSPPMRERYRSVSRTVSVESGARDNAVTRMEWLRGAERVL